MVSNDNAALHHELDGFQNMDVRKRIAPTLLAQLRRSAPAYPTPPFLRIGERCHREDQHRHRRRKPFLYPIPTHDGNSRAADGARVKETKGGRPGGRTKSCA
jgi:hypothetical protein